MAADLDMGFSAVERRDKATPAVTAAARAGEDSSAGLLSYRTVASIAMLAHMTCLWLLTDVVGGGLIAAQATASVAASMTVYGINATLYSHRRGAWRWYLGLLPFLASCGFGIAVSVLVAAWLTGAGADWFMAGLCGAAISLWWNQAAVERHGWSAN
jgi:dolichol-phosphate mannosyltransferase